MLGLAANSTGFDVLGPIAGRLSASVLAVRGRATAVGDLHFLTNHKSQKTRDRPIHGAAVASKMCRRIYVQTFPSSRRIGDAVLCQPVTTQRSLCLLRTAPTVFMLMLLPSASAMAMEYRVPVAKQLFTCVTNGVSRVATQTSLQPCCTRELKCAQFLSTTSVLRPIRDPRT